MSDTRQLLHIRLPLELKRALSIRAASTGVTLSDLARTAIERSLLAGGLASAIRIALAEAGLLECKAGRTGEVDLALGEALGTATGIRARVEVVARTLVDCDAVGEVYGTDPELRRAIRAVIIA